ncbi:MAG: hypothetical protein K8U57_20825 [Planctomycetes bacterium]|nr:hypothetical protein [Planctomycetota bacterium]
MLWSKKPAPVHEKSRAVGVDLTSTRARAVGIATGKLRPLMLEEPNEELPLFVALDRRTADIGRVGYSLCRKMPHAVCSNFLPALTQPREWRAGRHVITPEAALDLLLNKLRGPIAAESEAVVLALPAYLGPAQVTKLVSAASRAKLPLKGTVVGALALVADRAASILNGKPANPEAASPDVVPLRPTSTGPGVVAVIDADEFAVSAVVMSVERDRVKVLASTCWPRFAIKLWKDKLVDAVSDRCVRLCRRDPRDSADAEQALFEQLDDALDRTRAGQRVNLTLRTAHWFQDVIQQPEDFDSHCASLAHGAAESLRDFFNESGLPIHPRAVWLTHEAGRLPSFARNIHQNTPEGTSVEVLPPNAVAQAAANLAPRWLAAELPRAHLDAMIQLPVVSHQAPVEKPKTGRV